VENTHNARVFYSRQWSNFNYYYIRNGSFSGTTWVSRHKKGTTILDFNEAEMMRWQWHQLDHMQIIYTSLQTAYTITRK